RQLEHFVAAAEEGHFTRAARRMNIVQSGLSTSIRSLEAELGTQLFRRTTRRVMLTPAGRALLPHARRVLASVREAIDSVSEAEGVLRGTVAIGMAIALPPNVDAPRLISEFREHHPQVRVRLVEDASARLFDRLRS